MSRELLRLLERRPQLRGVDADFSHLLATWFNPGFLDLRRVDWNSPAALLERSGATAFGDPVARFHLDNGARLERINLAADLSEKGLKESLGTMVNYLYDLSAVESNHQRFVRGEVVGSRQVLSAARG